MAYCTCMLRLVIVAHVLVLQIVYLSECKVVEVGCSEDCQASCLQLLLMVMKRLPHVRAEFDEIGGVELIQQVLRTPQAAVGYKIADVCSLCVCYVCMHVCVSNSPVHSLCLLSPCSNYSIGVVMATLVRL